MDQSASVSYALCVTQHNDRLRSASGCCCSLFLLLVFARQLESIFYNFVCFGQSSLRRSALIYVWSRGRFAHFIYVLSYFCAFSDLFVFCARCRRQRTNELFKCAHDSVRPSVHPSRYSVETLVMFCKFSVKFKFKLRTDWRRDGDARNRGKKRTNETRMPQ